MSQKGPTVTKKYSCFKCDYCTTESYKYQADTGTDVYCEHPDFKEKKVVGDTSWSTPEFCPYRQNETGITSRLVKTHTEQIICPNCRSIETATVQHTAPFFTSIHTCHSCGHTIMESEWQLATDKRGRL